MIRITCIMWKIQPSSLYFHGVGAQGHDLKLPIVLLSCLLLFFSILSRNRLIISWKFYVVLPVFLFNMAIKAEKTFWLQSDCGITLKAQNYFV